MSIASWEVAKDIPTAFSSMIWFALVFAAAMLAGDVVKKRRRNEMVGNCYILINRTVWIV